MEAKDTVITATTPVALLRQEDLYGILREQAEISFKAGRKEAIEWLKEHDMAFDVAAKCEILIFQVEDWQAKLKEWGVE